MIETNQRYIESLSEVSTILNAIEKKLIDKLPNKLINFINENKSDLYQPTFDPKSNISKEQLMPETRRFLAYLYYMYWADESEKLEYKNLLKINETKYQNNLKEKYNPDNIFKNEKDIKQDTNTLSITQYKVPIIQKLINKIKNLLN